MERRAPRRSTGHHKRMQMPPVERKQQHRPGTSRQRTPAQSTPPGYFTVELVMVFLWATASLVFLPLVLPPLPPPPLLLLLLPVCLLAVLAALAFVPLDAQNNVLGSSCL